MSFIEKDQYDPLGLNQSDEEELKTLINRKYKFCDSDYDSQEEDGMEANFDEIEEEEAQSAWFGHQEDK